MKKEELSKRISELIIADESVSIDDERRDLVEKYFGFPCDEWKMDLVRRILSDELSINASAQSAHFFTLALQHWQDMIRRYFFNLISNLKKEAILFSPLRTYFFNKYPSVFLDTFFKHLFHFLPSFYSSKTNIFSVDLNVSNDRVTSLILNAANKTMIVYQIFLSFSFDTGILRYCKAFAYIFFMNRIFVRRHDQWTEILPYKYTFASIELFHR